jgi:hypothetical protein
MLELNDPIDQMDLTDVYIIFHSATGYTFFSASPSTFSKEGHIWGHKASLNKYKKTEISSSILSYHNGIKLEINNKRNSRKYSNIWISIINGALKK